FPEPLVPITMTKDPTSIVNVTSSRARTSLGVAAWKVFEMARASSMVEPCPAFREPCYHFRKDQRRENERRSNQLQVIWIQAGSQGDRHQQPEQHRTQNRSGDHQTELLAADQSLADDDARETPHYHPDSHLHVSETLILCEKRSGKRDQAVRQRQPCDRHI